MPEVKTEKTLEQRVEAVEKVAEVAVTIAKKVAAVLMRQFGIKILAFAMCAFMATPAMAVDTLFNPVGTAYSSATAKIIAESQASGATMKVDNVVATYGYFTDVTASGTFTYGGIPTSSNFNMNVYGSNGVYVGTFQVTKATTLGANLNVTGAITNSTRHTAGAIDTTGTVTATVGFIGGSSAITGAESAGYISTTGRVDATVAMRTGALSANSATITNLAAVGALTATGSVYGAVNVLGPQGTFAAATVSNLATLGAVSSTGTVTATVGGSFGGLVLGYVAKTNGYTPTVSDFTMVHTAGFEYTNTLADANTMLGRTFIITSADGTKDIFVNTDGTDTIQGSNKQAVFADTGDSITIQATGANVWTVIQNTGVTFGAIP